MTDKVQKIREEIERIQLYTQSETLKQVLGLIDSMQEEPVRIKKGCKYRCLSDMQNTDTGAISFFKDKIYSAPEDDTLVSEENGWLCDISENSSNFELVEEPVSEDLEEAARRYAALQAGMKDAMTSNYYEEYPYSPNDIEAFKAGAKWQKEQAIEEACEFIEDKIMEYLPYQLADSLLADFREALEKGDNV